MSDFLTATCVGVTQVLVGHPFDTVKILMQNRQRWLGLPFYRYYQGGRFPLVSGTVYNYTVFPTFEKIMKRTGSPALAGACAGIVVSPPRISVRRREDSQADESTSSPFSFPPTERLTGHAPKRDGGNGNIFWRLQSCQRQRL